MVRIPEKCERDQDLEKKGRHLPKKPLRSGKHDFKSLSTRFPSSGPI